MTQANQHVWRYRAAILNLTALKLRVRYNNSALGVLWSLGNPLFTVVVFTFVFTFLLSSDIPNYAIFALSAILPWNFFSMGLMNAIASVPGERELLTKLAFPREILPIASIGADMVNFSIAMVAINIILALVGQGAGWPLLTLPLLMLILVLFTAGLGMLLTAVNVWFRDVQEIMSIFLFGWFFMTPIVYSLEAIKPDLNGIPVRDLLQVVNPMSAIISSFRQVIYRRDWPVWESVAISGLLSLVLFVVGWVVFRTLSPRFAEEV
jgi:lipopolysaccharide transport system permease protein